MMVDVPNSPTSTSYVLVIDLGSTSLKAAVVENTGRILSLVTETNNTTLIPGGGAKQDAEAWWLKAIAASKKALAEAKIPRAKILAICCDSQYSVTVPVDRDAKPLMEAIHWFDSRGGKYTRRIMRGFPSVQGMSVPKALKWIKHTGLAPTQSGVDSLAHMLFIKHEYPEVYRNTYKFFEPVDYLTARLTNQFSASQHTAVMSMLTSNRQWGSTTYCDSLIKKVGLDREKLPDLIANNGIIGPLKAEISEEIGLDPATLVMTGMLDNQGALIGSGITDCREGMVYVGTSLNINAHTDRKKTDISHSIASIPGCLPDKYMLLCEQGLGGKCLDYFLERLVFYNDALMKGPPPEDCYQKINMAVSEIPPGSGNVLFLPWLNGAIAPAENSYARGGFFNLSLDATRAHMGRAVMEGVAFNTKAALKPVEKFLGRKMEMLRMAGGGALSDIWAQIYANVLEIPIHQLDEPQKVTCRGTGLVGFTRLGILAVDKIAPLVKIKQVFEPEKNNIAIYRKLYQQYCQIFKKNSKIFRALNQ
jgi:xylulokinase